MNLWEQIKKIRKKEKQTSTNPYINMKPQTQTSLKEETKKKSKAKEPKEIDKHAVVAFGRMNPPSKGHEAHINFVKNLAMQNEADPHVFLSHSEGDHRNPLTYDEKYKYARKAFGSVVKKADHRDIISVLKDLNKKYNHMNVVVGSDRHEEFGHLLSKYNGKEYNYKSLRIHSSGSRNAGLSSSHMRDATVHGNFQTFHDSLPEKLKKHAQELFDKVKAKQKPAK
jgi:hypothetical protein